MTSTTHSPHLAHQFDDLAQQRLAATLGMWSFLVTEVLFFGGMFAGYALYRFWYPTAFDAASRHLDLLLGTVNTVVLLTSSLTMALAVDASKRGDNGGVQRQLLFTILLAITFLGIKGYEYNHKWQEHLVPGPYYAWGAGHGGHEDGHALEAEELIVDDPEYHAPTDSEVNPDHTQLFFSFYFAMTGCHALHMVIGIGVLGTLWWAARNRKFSPEYYTPVENTGLYWHFVDIVWVFLFPLLYLIDRT